MQSLTIQRVWPVKYKSLVLFQITPPPPPPPPPLKDHRFSEAAFITFSEAAGFLQTLLHQIKCHLLTVELWPITQQAACNVTAFYPE